MVLSADSSAVALTAIQTTSKCSSSQSATRTGASKLPSDSLWTLSRSEYRSLRPGRTSKVTGWPVFASAPPTSPPTPPAPRTAYRIVRLHRLFAPHFIQPLRDPEGPNAAQHRGQGDRQQR